MKQRAGPSLLWHGEVSGRRFESIVVSFRRFPGSKTRRFVRFRRSSCCGRGEAAGSFNPGSFSHQMPVGFWPTNTLLRL